MGVTVRRDGDPDGGMHYSYSGFRRTLNEFDPNVGRRKDIPLTKADVHALADLCNMSSDSGKIDAEKMRKILPSMEKIGKYHQEMYRSDYEYFVEPFLKVCREAVQLEEGVFWK